MLAKFRQAKAAEIAALRLLKDTGGLPPPFTGARPSFTAALASRPAPAVIAEYKRASPSRGLINAGIEPEDAARMYAAAGAAAVSVLTEEVYFQGSLDFLEPASRAGLPLLRKDFILDPLQITATAATCASALLLIARMLDDAELAAFLALAASFGLTCVTEVFDESDLARAQAAGALVIQVNNRDLDTLTTDLTVSARLIAGKRPGEIWISASGLSRREELTRLADLGFDAVLIGSSLMAAPDPGAALAALTGKVSP